MKKLLTQMTIALFISLTVDSANAGFSDGGAALQDMLDAVTISPAAGSSIDVINDAIDDGYDSYWSVSASGSSIQTLVIELAAVQRSGNTFGIFEMGNPGNQIPLFDGSEMYGSKVVTLLDDFTVLVNFTPSGSSFSANGFGYYLETAASGTWYSDTVLNSDGWDHMMAYQGNDSDIVDLSGFAGGLFQSNEYILAFEDQPIGVANLSNYDDFVVLVESVTPIPEPATFVILGLGGLLLRKT